MDPEFVVKQATEPWEFEQIHRLNYETFVEEIPQHEPNAQRRLVDRFHDENTYFVCLHGREVVGMLAIRGRRPFSLDAKLKDLDSYLPQARALCELRLLALKPGLRHGRMLHRLLQVAADHMVRQGYDTVVISGLLEQERLYRHLGFVPFGPVVGHDGAQYQPMMLTAERYARVRRPIVAVEPPPRDRRAVYLMPGPVEVSPGVEQAFTRTTCSHRLDQFLEIHRQTCARLCRLAGARAVALLMGSGTLANDVIAGQLCLRGGRGVVLSNGEFGRRLVEQAERFGLDFQACEEPWGRPFDVECIRAAVEGPPRASWLWAVQCETSTGMVNDVEVIKALCREHDVTLCLDCVSSLGTIPVDLTDVFLASGVSGKGLGSYSGLSMVFYREPIFSSEGRSLPAYLDLAEYMYQNTVPYTMCSNLVGALHRALEEFNPPQRYDEIAQTGAWLRGELEAVGLVPLVEAERCNPAVLTLPVPHPMDAAELGDELHRQGFLVSYRSRYLLDRNWIQICLMGPVHRRDLRVLVQTLDRLIRAGAGVRV